MSLTVALTSFLAVLPAELPDKTVLACLILSSRYRPWYVFAGAATAWPKPDRRMPPPSR